jgi:hypothetical protein
MQFHGHRPLLHCHEEESEPGSAHARPDSFLLATDARVARRPRPLGYPVLAASQPRQSYRLQAAGKQQGLLVTGLIFLNDRRRNAATLADLLAPVAGPLANF